MLQLYRKLISILMSLSCVVVYLTCEDQNFRQVKPTLNATEDHVHVGVIAWLTIVDAMVKNRHFKLVVFFCCAKRVVPEVRTFPEDSEIVSINS